MKTIYIYDNELLGARGLDFTIALIDTKEFESEAEALAYFAEYYNANEYTASFNAPM